MGSFFTPLFPFWAFTLTGLGWLYAVLAYFGPAVFHRGVAEYAFATSMGYQFGRTIFWQLSKRAARLIAAASIFPLLALAGPDPIKTALLSIGSLLILIAWLTHSPGRQISLMDAPPGQKEGQYPVFALRANPGIARSIVVFLACGMIPALFFGAGMNWLLQLVIIH